MKTSESLRDSRMAYLLLLFISLTLCFVGAAAERSGRELSRLREASLRASLSECADSLRQAEAALTDEARLGAILRFELAAASLGCSDSAGLELRRAAGLLREGKGAPEGLIEVLERLSVAELGDDPYSFVSETLAPSEAVSVIRFEPRNAVDERWLMARASEAAYELLGEASVGLELVRDGDGFIGGCRNLRVDFSDCGPTLRELVFVHLDASGGSFTEWELCERASGLLGGEAELSRELCGLSLFECGEGLAVLDSAGRLWALLPAEGAGR